jgi:2-polyprenyl-3-methyl-5-hydroxy-6-metoxy-1,4-benzoquinol methylase
VSFTKYETRGAYHWVQLAQRRPNTYAARLHALYGWFVEEAVKRQPKLIVDVGCGDAALAHLLAVATRARVIGIEPEPRGVELAKEALARAGSSVDVVLGQGEELPVETRAASLVVMCEVIEHVLDAEALFAEATRALSPSGALLVSTPQWQRDELREHHVHEYRADELRDLGSRFFNHVAVFVSEPPGLYERYVGSRWWRAAINTSALLGRNPFSKQRPAAPERAGWRELLAIASAPRAR